MVYLIHLDEKLAHASHYIGFTKGTAIKRFRKHALGLGARMLGVCNEKGINYRISRV